MNKEEIIIICNSNHALQSISTGKYGDLSNKNIFTCNLAYSFFRTRQRHLNIFSDGPIIQDFIKCQLNKTWHYIYSTAPYNNVQFIYNTWDFNGHNFGYHFIKPSPVIIQGSSAIGALFYLNEVENFNTIHLTGYTLNEWENLEKIPELALKHAEFNKVFRKYELIKKGDFDYLLNRK